MTATSPTSAFPKSQQTQDMMSSMRRSSRSQPRVDVVQTSGSSKQVNAINAYLTKWKENKLAESTDPTFSLAKEVFTNLDQNGSGYIDDDDIPLLTQWVWDHLSFNSEMPTEVELEELTDKLLWTLDKDNLNRISFEVFLKWFEERCNDLANEQQYFTDSNPYFYHQETAGEENNYYITDDWQ